MTDVTAPLNELRAAYRAYQSAKRDKKEEITEKYRARMEDEIRAAVEAEKYAFASLLKDRKDFYGLNVTDIQDHVLRTRNWKVWEDIRDYADIKPEQILRDDARTAKRLANRGFRWEQDSASAIGWTLVIDRDAKGNEIPEIRVDTWSNTDGVYKAFPDQMPEPAALAEKHFGGWHGLRKFAMQIAADTREEIE